MHVVRHRDDKRVGHHCCRGDRPSWIEHAVRYDALGQGAAIQAHHTSATAQNQAASCCLIDSESQNILPWSVSGKRPGFLRIPVQMLPQWMRCRCWTREPKVELHEVPVQEDDRQPKILETEEFSVLFDSLGPSTFNPSHYVDSSVPLAEDIISTSNTCTGVLHEQAHPKSSSSLMPN